MLLMLMLLQRERHEAAGVVGSRFGCFQLYRFVGRL